LGGLKRWFIDEFVPIHVAVVLIVLIYKITLGATFHRNPPGGQSCKIRAADGWSWGRLRENPQIREYNILDKTFNDFSIEAK
jgi:hypothetical protein